MSSVWITSRATLSVATLAALLAGCATPSTQISTALTRYGLDQQRADCVGKDLTSHLSLGQLQQLGGAARAYRAGDNDPTRLTPGDLARAAAQIDDPAVPIAVAGAGVRCGIVAGIL